MGVLGGVALSYERGTPVWSLNHRCMPRAIFHDWLIMTHSPPFIIYSPKCANDNDTRTEVIIVSGGDGAGGGTGAAGGGVAGLHPNS